MAIKLSVEEFCIVHPKDDSDWVEASLKLGNVLKNKVIKLHKPLQLYNGTDWFLDRCDIVAHCTPWFECPDTLSIDWTSNHMSHIYVVVYNEHNEVQQNFWINK